MSDAPRPLVLGLETSCDETSAAVLAADDTLLGHVILSQDVHEVYGGVVPELAARAHLQKVDAVVDEALSRAGVSLHDIDVIGVSPDDATSHEKFSARHELSFPLLPDPDHEIIDAYGVWGEKKNYGKTFMGLQRTTFLIDEDGVIQHVFKRPRVAEHAEEIISKL